MTERVVTDKTEQKLLELTALWGIHQEGYIKDTLNEKQNEAFDSIFDELEKQRVGMYKIAKTLFESTKRDLRQDLLNLWSRTITTDSDIDNLEELVEASKTLLAIQYEYHLRNPFESMILNLVASEN